MPCRQISIKADAVCCCNMMFGFQTVFQSRRVHFEFWIKHLTWKVTSLVNFKQKSNSLETKGCPLIPKFDERVINFLCFNCCTLELNLPIKDSDTWNFWVPDTFDTSLSSVAYDAFCHDFFPTILTCYTLQHLSQAVDEKKEKVKSVENSGSKTLVNFKIYLLLKKDLLFWLYNGNSYFLTKSQLFHRKVPELQPPPFLTCTHLQCT